MLFLANVACMVVSPGWGATAGVARLHAHLCCVRPLVVVKQLCWQQQLELHLLAACRVTVAALRLQPASCLCARTS